MVCSLLSSMIGSTSSAEAALPVARAFVEDDSVPAPTNVCAQSGDGFVRLSWDATADAAVLGHVVQYRAEGTDTWTDGPTATLATSVDVPGTNGAPYEYRVAATGAGSVRSAWGSYCTVAWGIGSYDWAVGDGTTTSRSLPVPIRGGSLTGRSIVGINIFEPENKCALTSDGLVHCWSSPDHLEPSIVTAGALASHRLSSLSGRCGIDQSNLLICWGNNTSGQVGVGSDQVTLAPTVVDGGALAGHTVKRVASGRYHACAIRDDDRLTCWGSNTYGQVGDGTSANRNVPVLVVGGDLTGHTVIDVAVGEDSTCAVTEAHVATCWGHNQYGEVGIGATDPAYVLVPTAVLIGELADEPVREVEMASQQTCAVTVAGRLVCWGRSSELLDRQGWTTNTLVPITVDVGALATTTIRTVHPGGAGCGLCFITDDGRPGQWLSTGSKMLRQSPLELSMGTFYRGTVSHLSMAYPFTQGAAIWGGVVAPGEPPPAPVVSADDALVDDIKGFISWKADVLLDNQPLTPATGLVFEGSTDRGRTWKEIGACTECIKRTLNGRSIHLSVGRWWIRVRARSALGVSAPSAVVERYVVTWTQRTRRTVEVTFVTDEGRPIVGALVSWRHVRLGASTQTPPKTDSKGRVVLRNVPTGLLEFTLEGGHFRDGNSSFETRGYRMPRAVIPLTGRARVLIGAAPLLASRSLSVQLPDGTPVGGADIVVKSGLAGSTENSTLDGVTYSGFDASVQTDVNGRVTVTGFPDRFEVDDITVRFVDGTTSAERTASLAGPAVITLPNLPRVQLVGSIPPLVDPGAPLDVTVRAVDASFTPIGDASVSLTYTGLLDTKSAACTGARTGITSPDGTITFRICPKRAGSVRVDGVNLVALPPTAVVLGPRYPSVVRDLQAVAGAGQVTLSWLRPTLNGSSLIQSYTVEVSRNGKPWKRVAALSSATTTTTVTGLVAGNSYRFRVTAKNRTFLGTKTQTASLNL